MPEDTSLDTAIPPIRWQETTRETEPEPRRERGRKKKPRPAKPASKRSSPPPAEGTGTTIDVTV